MKRNYSEWKISENPALPEKPYGVFRILDVTEVDHSGNREGWDYYETMDEAIEVRDALNALK